jgi:hypothetical protein
MAENWITTREASKLSGYHPYYLRELIRVGKVKAQKWGRDWQVSHKSLVAYVHEAEKSADNRRGARLTKGKNRI